MENLTNIEDWIIVGRAMAKIAYNFWPCIAIFIGYCVYETFFMEKTQDEV
jgi:hypothetical protein